MSKFGSKIKSAVASISGETFNISLLGEFKEEIGSILWGVIAAYDGKVIAELKENEYEHLKHTLSTVLKIDKHTLEIDGYFSPDKSLEILTSLRKGQPSTELMWHLSIATKRYIEHLNIAMENGCSFFKFLVGNPGSGKTTFRDLLIDKIRVENPIITHTFGAQSTKNTLNLASTILFDKRILLECLVKLGELRASNPKEYNKAKSLTGTSNFYQILSPLFHFSNEPQTPASIIEFTDDYHTAITRWLELDRTSTLNQLNKDCGMKTGIIPRPKEANIIDFTSEIINFYNNIGVHPIWLLDEFEAHDSLRVYDRSKVMDYFRGLYDILARPEIKAYCLIFTTESGMTLVHAYPALKDRIVSGKNFSLTGSMWKMSQLERWDNNYVLSTIKSLYKTASTIEPSVTGEAYLEFMRLEDKLDGLILRELSCASVPRQKFMAIIANLIDPLSEHDPDLLDQIEKISMANNAIEQKKEFNGIQVPDSEKVIDHSLEKSNSTQTEPLSRYFIPKNTVDPIDPFDDEPSDISSLTNFDSDFETEVASYLQAESGAELKSKEESDIESEFDLEDDEPIPLFSGVSANKQESHIEFQLRAMDLRDSSLYSESNIDAELISSAQALSDLPDKKWSLMSLFTEKKTKETHKKNPDCLVFDDKLITFSGTLEQGNADLIIKKIGKRPSRSSIAKRYSRLRDLGYCLSDMDFNITNKIDLFWEDDSNDFEILCNLNLLLSASASGRMIPATRVKKVKIKSDDFEGGKEKFELVDVKDTWDLLSSLSITRTFVYTYLFNSNVFANDQNVDDFVIEWHKINGMKDTIPARNGVMFYTNDGMFDQQLENISDTYNKE